MKTQLWVARDKLPSGFTWLFNKRPNRSLAFWRLSGKRFEAYAWPLIRIKDCDLKPGECRRARLVIERSKR